MNRLIGRPALCTMFRSDTNLASPVCIKALLCELDLRPKRSLGQNFLVDRNILNMLIDAAALSPADAVLEVGPGLGIVTEELAQRVRQVTGVEKDERLAAHLAERFKGSRTVTILRADILDLDPDNLPTGPVDKVVANLPYSVGSRILVNLARMRRPPARVTVTVQKEVAQRLTAVPGTGDYGMLTAWCGLTYDVSLVRVIRPTCFWPRPGVSSAIVVLTARPQDGLSAAERGTYYDLTKRAFSQRRKQLATRLPALCPAAIRGRAAAVRLLRELRLGANVRPQDLAVTDWQRLARRLTSAPAEPIREARPA